MKMNYQYNELSAFNKLVRLAEDAAALQRMEQPMPTTFYKDVTKSFLQTKRKQVLPSPTFKRLKVSRDAEIVKRKLSQLIKKVEEESVKKTKEKNGGNWQCWSKEEEIFLVGAVLDRFFARGSLSSTKQENADTSKKNCWDTIKATYDSCFRKYSAQVGTPIPPMRTENALSRHYKVMKERSLSKNHKNSVNFRALYEEWEINFNQKYNLIIDPEFDIPSTKKKELMKSSKQVTLPSKGRWNYSDEVVLIGIVIETFFNRGSLSSSHKERKKKEKDLWQNLHEVYKVIKSKYNAANKIVLAATERTAQALARHFKVLKVKLIESNGKINLKTFYEEWKNNYRQFYLEVVCQNFSQRSTTKYENFPANNISSSPVEKYHLNENALMAKLRNSTSTMPLLPETKAPANSFAIQNSLKNMLSGLHSRPFGLNPTYASPAEFGFSSPIQAFDIEKVNESYNGFPTSTSTPSPTGSHKYNTFPSAVNPTPLITTAGNATTYWLPLTLYNVDNMKKCN